MAKKKKPARRNDVRGYGQAKPSPPTGPAAEAAAAKVQVTTKTHDGLKDLLGTLEGGATAKKRNTAPTSAVESDRFAGKLSNVVTRLEELGFSDESITRVVQAIKYDLTLDTALDWLCLQLTTEELPALFTEVHVRETSLQIQADDSSLTVLKLSAPVVLPTSMEASSSSRSETEFNLTVAAAATTTTAAAPKPSETKVEPSKEEQDAAQARKAWLLAQYAYEENDDSGNEEKGTTNDVLEKEETLVVVEKEKVAAAVAAAALSPQEQDLLKAENELKEMEADYNDEANNYMRSKLETKQLGLQVKNLRKQVQGLRKKVQKQKPKQVVNDDTAIDIGASANAMPLDAAVAAPAPELEDAEGAGCGGIFDMFNEANTETPAISSAEPTDGDESQEDNEPQVDYSIPKDWTGTTPTKTLDEWCKKRKLLRPKYIKIPRNQGGGYRLAVHVQKKGKPQEYKQSASGFIGNAQEYIALQALYALEPTLPLYRVFPLVFRDLWLSWVGEIQLAKDQVKHEETTAQREKIDRLLALIESSSSTNGAAKKAFGESKQQPSAAKSGQEEDDNITEPVFESWEDDDTHADTQDEIATTKRKAPSAASTKLKDLFVKRQSTAAYQEMKKVRTSLPMHGFRENVLDIIRDNPVTVLCAETGAGKTTQCPQYLLEDALLHGRGDAVNILCTQPRRVAATSVAERVAEEMCEPSIGQMVGYQIRMEAKRSSRTKLLFCTTGIVLRRLQEDSTLKGVSHVIVDEVHERQQQTDVLLIALRRLLNTARPDLKVILMSATLDSELFCSFFHGAPLCSVPGRTFPVNSFYLEDLMDATGHVIEEGSRNAVRENTFGGKASLSITTRGGEKRKEVVDLVSQTDVGEVSAMYPGYKMSTRRSMDRVNEEVINNDLIEDVLNLILVRTDSNDILVAPEGGDLSRGSVLIFLPGLGEIRSLTERLEASRTLGNSKHFKVIPMHSTLSSIDQRKVFVPAKPGCRKIILSTNIAETSITIPDVVCVIDCGRVREVRQNKRTSTSTLVTDWCSKASAKQRAGRAGRVQPGICLKLYSSRTANVVMKDTSEPELKRVPLEEVCLSILASGFASSCMAFLRQAPQPPSEESVQSALTVLLEVGAISLEESEGSRETVERLTPLGQHLSKLPVNVRLGKMLIFGALFHCIDKVLTVAAGLSSQSPFATFVTDAKIAQAKQKAFADPDSDFMTLCNVWEAYNDIDSPTAGRKFCSSNYLNHVALREIRDGRLQFLDLLCNIGFLDRSALSERGNRKRWSEAALRSSVFNENGDKPEVVHAVICAGLFPNVAHVIVPVGATNGGHVLWHRQERLHFHSSSVNSNKKRFLSSERWIAFHEKFGTPHRVSVSTTCFVHPLALLLFGGSVAVKHLDRKVIVDDWIEIGMAASTGVMMRELRRQVNDLLKEMIQDVKSDEKKQQGATMVDGIVKILVS